MLKEAWRGLSSQGVAAATDVVAFWMSETALLPSSLARETERVLEPGARLD